MYSVKGMVQVLGTTYRISRIERGHYEVVRILDDSSIGSFRAEPQLVITSGSDEGLLRSIARAAVQTGKTSWIGLPQLP